MQREIGRNGTDWKIVGVGFDDVAISATSTEATVTNRDDLNATQNDLRRRFDATPYVGQTVRVTGEVRSDDLVGFVVPMAEVRTRDASVIATTRGARSTRQRMGTGYR
jgi:hypothetical protein